MKKALQLLLGLMLVQSVFGFEVGVSTLSAEKPKAELRERAFTPWIPLAESQARFDLMTSPPKDMIPIYNERRGGEVRDIYIKKPDGCSFWTFAGMDVSVFSKRNEKHGKEGFVLVSCSGFANQLGATEYWATWVDKKSEKAICAQLKKLGIGQATAEK